MSHPRFRKPSPGLRAAGLVGAALLTTLLFWAQFGFAHYYDEKSAAEPTTRSSAPVAQSAAASVPRM